jgi:hypothetical protein
MGVEPMKTKVTFKTYEDEVAKLFAPAAPRPCDVLLLASSHTGPSAEKLRLFSGKPRSVVREAARRFRVVGIWKGHIDADWFGEDGGLSFILDTQVVAGLVKRIRVASP